MYEDEACDRCDALIVYSELSGVTTFSITSVDDSTPTTEYQVQDRVLCRKCEQELLEWIDGGEVDREQCVDLPCVDHMADTLDTLGDELTDIANKLEAHNAG